MKSKVIIATLIFIVLSMVMGAVSAQDAAGRQPGQAGIQPIQSLFGELIRVVAETTGLTPQEIVQQIGDGASLSDVITANGGDVETIVDTVLRTVSTRLQEQVDADNLTQALADQLLATAEQFLRDWVNGDLAFPHLDRPTPIRDRIGQGILGELARVVTETTGLTLREIAQEIRDGATLGEVIDANGGNVDTVINTVLENTSSHLQEQVDAGNLSSEQMTSIMEVAQQRLTDWMNGEAPFPLPNRRGNPQRNNG
jgi:hypothetical protein